MRRALRWLRTWRLLPLVLALLTIPVLTGCSSTQAKTTTQAVKKNLPPAARAAYSAGILAVKVVEEARIVWMQSYAAPTAEQVATAQKVNDLLHAAGDALTVARGWLVTGEGEAEGKKKLRDGLGLLVGAIELLNANGGETEEALLEGLTASLELLGGAS